VHADSGCGRKGNAPLGPAWSRCDQRHPDRPPGGRPSAYRSRRASPASTDTPGTGRSEACRLHPVAGPPNTCEPFATGRERLAVVTT
jgi:hypothetical protein